MPFRQHRSSLFLFLVSALVGIAQPPCPEIKVQAGPWKGTPLHEAIRRNDPKAARRLMTTATVNERDSFGITPLVAALTPAASLEPAGIIPLDQIRLQIQIENKARPTIVSELVAKGANVSEPSASGITPLIQLAAFGYSPAIDRRLAEKFLRSRSHANARDDFGSTALMLAARRGKMEMVKLLLSRGADPKINNCRGETAASLAQFGGFTALSLLLANY
jgi:hypothetical protein